MRIPHTIPELILRVYTRKLSPEQLEQEKNGRLLRSEDTKWDEDKPSVSATLAEYCLKKLVESYPIVEGYVEEGNRRHQDNYNLGYETWQRQHEEYLMQKSDYDRVMYAIEARERAKQERDLRYHSDSSEDDVDLNVDDTISYDIPVLPIPVPKAAPLKSMTSVLDQLNGEDRVRLVEELNPEEISVEMSLRIRDEHYWKKQCLEKFPEAFVEDYGKSWKRLYAEKTLREAIEFFHPFDGDWDDLNKTLKRYGPFTKALTLNNLIPVCYGVPLKPVVPDVYQGDEEMMGDEDEGYMESAYMIAKNKEAQIPKATLDEQTEKDKMAETRRYDKNHFDFSLVLPKIRRLRKLSIIVTMAELGLDYEPRFAEFTWTDCENLAKALAACRHVQKLKLQRSRVTDEQTKLLVRDGLLHMRHLRHLNLSYNPLGNAGATAIARLINDTTSDVPSTLHTLILASCKIGRRGAKALAFAISRNTHLKKFSIRLNPIHDKGGKAILNALVYHETIISMDLSGTHIGNPTSILLGRLFVHNDVMREINLSSNPGITNLGVKLMAKSFTNNESIYVIDFRLTEIEGMMEYDMLKRLREKFHSSGYTYHNHISIFSKEEELIIHWKPELEESVEDLQINEASKDEILGEDDDEGCVFIMKPKPLPKKPRIPAKFHAREEVMIRRLIRVFGDDTEDVYEPRLTGELLDNYITFLEDKTKVIDRKRNRKIRNRWAARRD